MAGEIREYYRKNESMRGYMPLYHTKGGALIANAKKGKSYLLNEEADALRENWLGTYLYPVKNGWRLQSNTPTAEDFKQAQREEKVRLLIAERDRENSHSDNIPSGPQAGPSSSLHGPAAYESTAGGGTKHAGHNAFAAYPSTAEAAGMHPEELSETSISYRGKSPEVRKVLTSFDRKAFQFGR
jgi:hypothetical protein